MCIFSLSVSYTVKQCEFSYLYVRKYTYTLIHYRSRKQQQQQQQCAPLCCPSLGTGVVQRAGGALNEPKANAPTPGAPPVGIGGGVCATNIGGKPAPPPGAIGAAPNGAWGPAPVRPRSGANAATGWACVAIGATRGIPFIAGESNPGAVFEALLFAPRPRARCVCPEAAIPWPCVGAFCATTLAVAMLSNMAPGSSGIGVIAASRFKPGGTKHPPGVSCCCCCIQNGVDGPGAGLPCWCRWNGPPPATAAAAGFGYVCGVGTGSAVIGCGAATTAPAGVVCVCAEGLLWD